MEPGTAGWWAMCIQERLLPGITLLLSLLLPIQSFPTQDTACSVDQSSWRQLAPDANISPQRNYSLKEFQYKHRTTIKVGIWGGTDCCLVIYKCRGKNPLKWLNRVSTKTPNKVGTGKLKIFQSHCHPFLEARIRWSTIRE